MSPALERELAALANAPLQIADLELLEVEAVDAMVNAGPGSRRDRAKLTLRMTAEIRKARGLWDHEELTEREVDAQFADLRVGRGAGQ